VSHQQGRSSGRFTVYPIESWPTTAWSGRGPTTLLDPLGVGYGVAWRRGFSPGAAVADPKPERDAFLGEATSGDYEHLLGTVMKYLDVG
jgi:hypothetical protein